MMRFKMNEWKPIETLPRNYNMRFLVFTKNGVIFRAQQFEGLFNIDVPILRGINFETQWTHLPIMYHKNSFITHWMPIPTLPSELYGISGELKKNKLDKTSIKFYLTMIFLWILCLIASWMQHIFIFILCESVSVAVVCLIIRRRIKHGNFNKW